MDAIECLLFIAHAIKTDSAEILKNFYHHHCRRWRRRLFVGMVATEPVSCSGYGPKNNETSEIMEKICCFWSLIIIHGLCFSN